MDKVKTEKNEKPGGKIIRLFIFRDFKSIEKI